MLDILKVIILGIVEGITAAGEQYRTSDPCRGSFKARAQRFIYGNVQCRDTARRDHGGCCAVF